MNSTQAITPCGRLFPPLTDIRAGTLCHAEVLPDQACAAAIIQRGMQPLGKLASWTGFMAGGQKRFTRLFLHYRLATDAETIGAERRADFFWMELHKQMSRFSESPELWRAVVDAANVPNMTVRLEPEDVYRRFVGEVLIESHLSFYEAWFKLGNPRAFRHLHYTRKLLDGAGFSVEQKRAAIGSRTVQEIELCEREGHWGTALRLAEELLRLFPEATAYQNKLARVRAGATLARLSEKDNFGTKEKNARTLAVGLYEIKKLRQEYPHNMAMFEAIAGLHMKRAEVLASAGMVADALVDVEAALIYWPAVEGGTELRTKVEDELQQLRVQSAAADPKQRTKRGREAKLQSQQVAKGFRLVDAFRRSDEARAVEDDRSVALARRLWESIGLGPLERADLRPMALDDAFQTIFHAPPRTAAEVSSEWDRVSRDNPHLHILNAELVCSYLSSRLFGTAFTFMLLEPAPAEVPPAPLSVTGVMRSSEPFTYWLFSGRDVRIKLQGVLAIALAVVAVVLTTAEYSGRSNRTAAYEALRLARDQGNYETMLDAGERFLSVHIIGRDDRVAEVEALYSEAIVRWFNGTVPDQEAVDRRTARYRQLLSISTAATQ